MLSKKHFNKYVIGLNIIFLLIIFLISHLFKFKIQWYYIVVILFIADYIGRVIYSTFEGFNIINIMGFDDVNNYSHFVIEVVYDFKGSIAVITGRFINNQNLSKEDLKMIMFNKANIKILLKGLENDVVDITFHYNNSPINVEFLPAPILKTV